MDKEKIMAYVRLERPQFSIMSFLSPCAGMIAAYGGFPEATSLLGVGLLFWFIHNVAHPINDYFDREIDVHARPEAPLPSNDLTPTEAKRSIILHYTVAPLLIVFVVYLLPVKAVPFMTVAFLGLLLTAVYSAPPIRLRKRGFLKDIAIGLVIPIPFIGGWLAIQGWSFDLKPLAVVSVFFLLSAGAQLLADIHDMKGEKRAGWKTVPVRIGVKNTFTLSFVMGVLAALIIPITIFMEWFNIYYTVIGLFIMFWTVFFYLKSFLHFDPEKGRVLNQNLLIGVTIYIVAVIVGSV